MQISSANIAEDEIKHLFHQPPPSIIHIPFQMIIFSIETKDAFFYITVYFILLNVPLQRAGNRCVARPVFATSNSFIIYKEA